MALESIETFRGGICQLKRLASRSLRYAVMTALATSVAIAGPAPNPPSDPGKPVWNALLTPCGQSYFYAGSFFDRGGMLSSLGAGNNPDIYEFRGVRFNTVPVRITDAERLNGLEYHARVTMIAHVYREAGGTWADGPDLQARNTNDILALALQSVGSNMGEMGIGGSMAFDLARVKGKWVIARSSSDLSGPLTFGTNYYDVGKLNQFVPKKTCSQLGAQIVQKQNVETAEQNKEAHDAAVQKAWQTPGPVHDPKRGIPFRLLSEDDYALVAKWYDPSTHGQGGDAVFLPAETIVHSYPIVPNPGKWLAVGTTFQKDDSLPAINPENGFNKLLVVVRITSGPHNGQHAIIESANYGSSDLALAGRVWPTVAEGEAADAARVKKAQDDAFADEQRLIRDPVKGIPFTELVPGEFEMVQSLYDEHGMTKGDFQYYLHTWKNLIARFPSFVNADADDDDDGEFWLAPGTTYDHVCLTAVPTGQCSSVYGFDKYVIIRVTSGPHSGVFAMIDRRNYGSNVSMICDARYPGLKCDKATGD